MLVGISVSCNRSLIDSGIRVVVSAVVVGDAGLVVFVVVGVFVVAPVRTRVRAEVLPAIELTICTCAFESSFDCLYRAATSSKYLKSMSRMS